MEDYAALAEAVKARRTELGIKQTDSEFYGGPSTGTLRNVEQCARVGYHRRTFKDIEAMLKWRSGTCNRILAGSEHKVQALV